eukprot:m.150699 g.150699  ORF g.150699 m.150699 type:complete len:743 (-) comp16318_c0_seq4:57-2285(-)
MFHPAFSFKLGYNVLPGRVCAGVFDGRHPCLACASSGGKVVLHNPHQGDDAVNNSAISLLNFNREITCLTAGSLDTSKKEAKDWLFIGTATSLNAYEVDNNRDIFHIEAPDGANAIALGRFNEESEPVVIIGGSCSIYGYNHAGEDTYWTVTGDNVSALAMAPVLNVDREHELIVGSEDFDLRIFNKDADMLHEFAQREAVTLLCALSGRSFAFALSNGTIGVLNSTTVAWSHKLKAPATSLAAFDVNLDGVPELVVGYASGGFDVRAPNTGDVLVQDKFDDPVAGFAVIDYRLEGFPSLIAVSTAGHARGYHALGTKEAAGFAQAVTVQGVDTARLQRLKQRKQDLLYQLKQMQDAKPELDDGSIALSRAQLSLGVKAVEGKGLQITATVDSGCTCTALILSGSSALFGTDAQAFHSTDNDASLTAFVIPPSLTSFTIEATALAGAGSTSTVFRALHGQLDLPQFFGLCPIATIDPLPLVKSALMVPAIAPVGTWLDQQLQLSAFATNTLTEPVFFRSVADDSSLSLQYSSGLLLLGSDSDQLVGDLTHALASQLSLKVVQVPDAVHRKQAAPAVSRRKTADAALAQSDPAELARLVAKDAAANPDDMKYLLTRIGDLHKARQRLSAEIADGSNLTKALLLRAEDHRLMGDIQCMKEAYSQLHAANRDLLTAYSIRSTNHEELVQSLKALNQVIQNTARLQPAGEARTIFVGGCRECIKANDMTALYALLQAATQSDETTV